MNSIGIRHETSHWSRRGHLPSESTVPATAITPEFFSEPTMRPSSSLLAASLCVSVISVACAPRHQSAAGSIAANDWHLAEISGTAAIPTDEARRPTLHFSEDSSRASGNGGCNTYSGTAVISGQKITMSRLISTKRACIDPALNAQETRFLSALEAVDRYELSGDTLRLYRGPDLSLRFIR
jgi:putative lipoprotein